MEEKIINLERLPSDLKNQIIQKEKTKKTEKKTALKLFKKMSQNWRMCAYRLTEPTKCPAELLKIDPLQGTLLSHFKALETKR